MAVLKHTYMIFVESTGFSVVHEAQSLGFSVVFGGSLFCSVVFF